ncbi:hypothetical protein GRZ55_10805 [Chelativorans sp. ZYF759]|uniref:hypothetical protein n=1 Tax=Chelativorans sp. ZYF759 TaxID=2692213 RepID=UPI00145CBDD8|nr:hypothetical protein [Chelativorans sp. ZYF759]NMG39731.1 hypothetical protein [Chelativorans sp. ZYF759]
MPQIAENFFKLAVVFLIFGILMGLQMSISGNHSVIGAHAHTNLVGWVTMALFGGYYAVNPAKAETRLARIHFWSFAVAAVILAPSLYAMYMGFTAIEPLLAISSIVAFLSVLVFAAIVFTKAEATVRPPATAAAA